MLTMTHKEVMDLLKERLDCDFTVIRELDPESGYSEMKGFYTPLYMRRWYRSSGYRLLVFDDVGDMIAVLHRMVPVDGGNVVYETNEVMEQLMYKGL